MLYNLEKKFDLSLVNNSKFGQLKLHKVAIVNLKLNIQKTKIVGFCNVSKLKELEMTDDEKKFDYVVGNPPYQDSRDHGKKITGNGPLWVQFTKIAIDRLEKDGTLAFIIPDSVLAPTYDMMGSRISIFNDIFKMKNLKLVNSRIKKYFPNVGINPIAFILENNRNYVKTNFNGKKINISNMIFCPKDDSKISLSIHKKILSSNENLIKFKMRWNNNIKKLDDAKEKKSGKHIFPVLDHHSYKDLRWSIFKDPDFDRKKILVTYIGKYQCVADNGNCGAKRQVSVRLVQENETLEGVYSFYNSSLIHWVMNSNKWTQYLLSQILNYIPTPDLKRVWSDQEIFEHFCLSNREIKYIEALKEGID